jgi:ketosteroid isomerase-like protein
MTDDGVRSLIERVRNAINRHDLDAFLDCFHEAYESEQPLDPERSFRGRDRVRRNWSANLARVPDLRWDLLDASVTADAAWCEWRWHGTRFDGRRFRRAGRRDLPHRGRPDRTRKAVHGRAARPRIAKEEK